MKETKIHLVAAARPNFMKIAPLLHALNATEWARPVLIHTGQHYDRNMSEAILEDLGVPRPDYHLGVGSGTHAEQTGRVMIAYEAICFEDRPDWIVVAGDVNSTVACAMVGAKLLIPVVHLEAGLRSCDRSMPEEINRIVTDAISDVLWTPSEDADRNLVAEGVDIGKIDRIGNIMIDSFEMLRKRIEREDAAAELGLEANGFGLATIHRPANVDDHEVLQRIVNALIDISIYMPIAFVVHPRTMKAMQEFDLMEKIQSQGKIKVLEPMPYVRFMGLVTRSAVVITDSGGLQEETTYLNIPCLTLRSNTERPITITSGTNKLVSEDQLHAELSAIVDGNGKKGSRPALWDGRTAERAVAALHRRIYGH
jgi:UDP-N-acetylglucosamine 2-epimerase (non-hydrolysing)